MLSKIFGFFVPFLMGYFSHLLMDKIHWIVGSLFLSVFIGKTLYDIQFIIDIRKMISEALDLEYNDSYHFYGNVVVLTIMILVGYFLY